MQFLIEMLTYWRKLCRYNASRHTEGDMQKMQYTLLRRNHIIEKGMSMRKPKHGFGQAKVLELIESLRRYNQRYGTADKAFLRYPLATIKTYIEYQQHNGVDIAHIESQFEQLCREAAIPADSLSTPAGVETVAASYLQQEATANFERLLLSRHSIRFFENEQPSRALLEKALALAARTPSACNRQAWHTHIYFGDDTHRLLRMQTGCNGFCDDIHCAIVVTANMKGFLGHEPFQCYIDGALYAQNLINALHYVGLGTIPLSCGFMSNQLSQMQRTFNIPDNEVLIVIIGTGIMCKETKIAVSTRKPVSTTNTYH